ncbi:MAG: PD-(D/E)XK motif protein [Acidobacteria bacterium]|nr:PD-(D/E)XK motif protein [Acidobacteriota bacterium]
MTLIDNPWDGLPPAAAASGLSARRVDLASPYGFFWARGADRHCLLLLKHPADASPKDRLPKLKGIDIEVAASDEPGTAVLVLRLVQAAHRDVFYRLCLDIVETTKTALSYDEAVSVAVARTWRWHHLLRGGTDGRLSLEEQKGLIGELTLLRRLTDQLSISDALAAWRGPLGAPKDFEVGRVAVEVKARRGAARPFIAISSEHQLDASGVDALLLNVLEIDLAPVDGTSGRSLTDLAERQRRDIQTQSPSAEGVFDSLLTSAGFRWADDYSDARWVIGLSHFYQVSEGFPALAPSQLRPGVVDVRYSVALEHCEPFRVPEGSFGALIEGQVQ